MATPASQRIGIWIITIVMVVGVVGSFAVMILSNKNDQQSAAALQKAQSDYQKAQTEYQKKVDAQAAELSKQYYPTFSQYKNAPAAFDEKSVTSLQTQDLVAGTGDTLTKSSSFSAYYIGWTANGTMFDSSFSGDSLKEPLAVTPGGVIDGWTEGVVGMKVGGIRELTIPADKAYGANPPQGSNIPANAPLKFILMVIPTPPEIPQPEIPEALLKQYQSQTGQ